MTLNQNFLSHSTADLLRVLMEEELDAVKIFGQHAAQTGEPTYYLLFQQLADMHRRCYIELEQHARELQSQDEITRQINAMFCEG